MSGFEPQTSGILSDCSANVPNHCTNGIFKADFILVNGRRIKLSRSKKWSSPVCLRTWCPWSSSSCRWWTHDRRTSYRTCSWQPIVIVIKKRVFSVVVNEHCFLADSILTKIVCKWSIVFIKHYSAIMIAFNGDCQSSWTLALTNSLNILSLDHNRK